MFDKPTKFQEYQEIFSRCRCNTAAIDFSSGLAYNKNYSRGSFDLPSVCPPFRPPGGWRKLPRPLRMGAASTSYYLRRAVRRNGGLT